MKYNSNLINDNFVATHPLRITAATIVQVFFKTDNEPMIYMIFESIHHIAIIGRNYNKTKEFYVKKLGFKIISEYHRVDKMIL